MIQSSEAVTIQEERQLIHREAMCSLLPASPAVSIRVANIVQHMIYALNNSTPPLLDHVKLMQAVASSLKSCDGFDERDIAARWASWNYLRRNKPLCYYTAQVLYHIHQGDPHEEASKFCWERSGRFASQSGPVIRGLPLLLLAWDDPIMLSDLTRRLCRITHWDSVCADTCSLYNLILQTMVKDYRMLGGRESYMEFFEEVIQKAIDYTDNHALISEVSESMKTSLSAMEYDGSALSALKISICTASSATSAEAGMKALKARGWENTELFAITAGMLNALWERNYSPLNKDIVIWHPEARIIIQELAGFMSPAMMLKNHHNGCC